MSYLVLYLLLLVVPAVSAHYVNEESTLLHQYVVSSKLAGSEDDIAVKKGVLKISPGVATFFANPQMAVFKEWLLKKTDVRRHEDFLNRMTYATYGLFCLSLLSPAGGLLVAHVSDEYRKQGELATWAAPAVGFCTTLVLYNAQRLAKKFYRTQEAGQACETFNRSQLAEIITAYDQLHPLKPAWCGLLQSRGAIPDAIYQESQLQRNSKIDSPLLTVKAPPSPKESDGKPKYRFPALPVDALIPAQ